MARELDLEDGEIDAIEADNPYSTHEQAYKAMTLWTRKMGQKATKDDVIVALKEIGKDDLASEL